MSNRLRADQAVSSPRSAPWLSWALSPRNGVWRRPEGKGQPQLDAIKLRRMVRMGGYSPSSARLYRAWNVAVVVPLLAFCLPLIVLIAAILAVTQGPRNVFYFGERIGKDHKTFRIIKFKTLRDDAALVTRNRVLPTGTSLETPIGRHLRDTRLDELPQLINVLLGSMNMFGPRPVRPSIANACRATIANYDVRFRVKPGLIGYTQALMPHGADKNIRARVNAIACRRQVHLLQELLFIGITAVALVQWTARVVWRVVASRTTDGGLQGGVRPRGGAARLAGGPTLRLLSLNQQVLLLECAQPLPAEQEAFHFTLSCTFAFIKKRKSARCTAVLVTAQEVPTGAGPQFRYIMRYQAASPLHQYLIQRYLIGSVVVR